MELTPEQLYKESSLAFLEFQSTKEIVSKTEVIGQDRAIEAIEFAMNMPNDGYNVFCVGADGSGKKSLALQLLEKEARRRPRACDWCYVNNFDFAHKPKAVKLPTGRAKIFAKDVLKFVSEVQNIIPSLFDGEVYQNNLHEIEESFKAEKERYYKELEKIGEGKKNVAILRMPTGLVVAPTKNGEVLTPEVFDKLPKAERKRILEQMNVAQAELQEAVSEVPTWEKEQKERINELNFVLCREALAELIKEPLRKYAQVSDAKAYFNAMVADMAENFSLFLNNEEEEESDDVSGVIKKSKKSQAIQNRYKVNVLIHTTTKRGAPVIYLAHPNLPNLVGRMERQQQFGALVTDFSLIKAGALHQANGGFLIIDANDLAEHPLAWEALKRSLRSRAIHIETTEEESGVMSTTTLEPEAIPLNIKVVLVGNTCVYYQMVEQDSDFQNLFKVEAHFTPTVDRTNERMSEYAFLISALTRKYKIRALTESAVERLIEYASRRAENQNKMTTRFSLISDLMKEADYYARKEKSAFIDERHIDEALKAQNDRSGSQQAYLIEQIKNGVFLLNTTGEAVGEINILAVREYGHVMYGFPSRLTCQTCLGKGEIIDIEREVELGGPIHSKGVFILSSFLAAKFAQKEKLSVCASLAIEQSYTPIDGDSASSAELYALISSLSDIPIRQGIAVTGSVNQRGQVQAIGGVNEKIEGFFDVCKMKGLTGEQGVVIPKANIDNLMLRKDVVEAVKNKEFHIYAVETIEEGLEILTGRKAGTLGNNGWTKGSVYSRVASKLHKYYESGKDDGDV